MNIIIIILIIIAIPFILALFVQSEYFIERQIIINKPVMEVFNYIKFLKNAGNYNKWVMTDPNMKKEYKGTDGTVGFIYSWDSNNKQVGKGEQEIINIRNGERIDYEIRFVKPFEGKSNASLTTETTTGNFTKVTWVFKGIRNYPMKIMHMLFNLKKVLGKDLAASLANLKTVLEK
jgi:Polyketide cyclase / dehydrase and lipid transport